MSKQYTLRPYQQADIDFMSKHLRVLNANEPGLGKTLEALVTREQINAGKTLIVSPKMAAGVWQFEAKQWFDYDSMVITGEYKPKQRAEMRREFSKSNLQFMMINFALLAETQEAMPVWNTIIVDEAHLGGLLNPKSKTFKLMQKMECTNLYILTGTPVRKGPQDLWPMLHLLNPKKFPAYWPFVNRYCHVIEGRFGKEILGRPKDPIRFNEMLRCYMVRNLKKDVLEDLPDKQRQPIPLTMEGVQLESYNELLNEMMLDIGDDILLTPNRMTQDLRLRQLAVCPRLLGIDDDGVALRALCEELVPMEFDAKRAVVIATPFRQAVQYIEAALLKAIPDVHLEFIHGQIKETAQEVAQRFQEIPTHRKILIYTIKSGASWTAHSASTGFMLGYEWSTNDNLQAEDRIHRFGQKEKVFWKYLLHYGTVDESVMNRLDEKAMANGWILRPEEMYAKLEEIRRRNLDGRRVR